MACGPPLPPATAATRIQLAASAPHNPSTSPPTLNGLVVSNKSAEGTSQPERAGTGVETSTPRSVSEASDSLPGTAASGGASSGRKFCLTCHKPSSVCICGLFQGCVENATGITILQHPKEKFHPLGSARIALLGLQNISLIVVPLGVGKARVTPKIPGSKRSLAGRVGSRRRWFPQEGGIGGDRDGGRDGGLEEGGDRRDLGEDLGGMGYGREGEEEVVEGEGGRDEEGGGVEDGEGGGGGGSGDKSGSWYLRKGDGDGDGDGDGEGGDVTKDLAGQRHMGGTWKIVPDVQSSEDVTAGGIPSWVRLPPGTALLYPSDDAVDLVPEAFQFRSRESSQRIEEEGDQGTGCEFGRGAPGSVGPRCLQQSGGLSVQIPNNVATSCPPEMGVVGDGTKTLACGGEGAGGGVVPTPRPTHLIVLDGTWAKAKRVYCQNPWLKGLVHYKLRVTEPSRYGFIRREPKMECISTVESIVYALKAIEPETEGLDSLLNVFDSMVTTQERCMGANGKAPMKLRARVKKREGRGQE